MEEKTIGALAKFTGVSAHTIKYYEKLGLIQSRRDEHSNYRSYNIRVCKELYECIQYRNMGFSLKETEYLLKKADDVMLHSMLENRVNEIEQEMERLKKVQQQIQRYKQEIDVLDEELGKWFIEQVPDLYFYPQTKNLSYREDAPIDEAMFELDGERIIGRSVLTFSKEYLNGGAPDFSWGKGFFLDEAREEFEEKGFSHMKKGRAFVFYQKFAGHFSSNGEMAEAIRKTYHRFQMKFQSDAYAVRMKYTHDKRGCGYEYFKVVIPFEERE